MKLLRSINRPENYRDLIQKTIAISLSAFMMFSVLLAIWLFYQTENEILAEQKRMSGQTVHAVDDINKQIQSVSTQIMQDPQATSYLYERLSYNYPQSEVETLLQNYTKSHSQLIRYIGLYNGYLGTYETSIGTLPAGQMGMPVGNSQFSLRPREIKLEGSALEILNSEYARLVVFYARVDDNPQRTNHGLVIVHLDEQVFINLFAEYRPSTDIYLTDINGIVFASNQPEAFITDLSMGRSFSGIFQNTSGTRQLSDEGVFQEGALWNRQLTYFRRAPETGLYEIIVVKAGTIWHAFLIKLLIALLIETVVFALLIWAILKLMQRFFSPFQNLVQQVNSDGGPDGQEIMNEYEILHKALIRGDQANRVVSEKYIRDLILGNPISEDSVRFKEILADFHAGAYLLIIARFDGYSTLVETNASDLNSFRFVIINITQELMSVMGTAQGVVLSDSEVALMIQLPEPLLPPDLDTLLNVAQTQIRRYFPFSVTVAYDLPITDLAKLNELYLRITNLFNYRLYYGPNTILSPQKTLVVNKNIRYPAMAEKRILEALNLRRQDLILAGIDDFMQVISAGYSPRTANYFNQLLFSVFKQVDNTVELVEEDYENYAETTSRLIRSDNFDECRQIISRFCLELMSISQEKTRSATDQKHEKLHEELLSYLKENLADPNLSLETTADRFKLSTGYLGKLVKASSGESFSSLLSAIRLERAAELLTSTNQPAYRIAELVGIPNVAYFSTLFKKQYGLSPAPYREKRGEY